MRDKSKVFQTSIFLELGPSVNRPVNSEVPHQSRRELCSHSFSSSAFPIFRNPSATERELNDFKKVYMSERGPFCLALTKSN